MRCEHWMWPPRNRSKPTSATSAPESIPGIPESVNTSQLIERVDADTGIITLEETEIYDKSTNSSSLISKTLDTASSVTSTAISAASDAASNVKDSLSFDSSTFSDPLLAEWSNVDVSIWAKLLRVQKQTGNTYTVLHGVKEKTSTTADMELARRVYSTSSLIESHSRPGAVSAGI